jgi:hypothetical protein
MRAPAHPCMHAPFPPPPARKTYIGVGIGAAVSAWLFRKLIRRAPRLYDERKLSIVSNVLLLATWWVGAHAPHRAWLQASHPPACCRLLGRPNPAQGLCCSMLQALLPVQQSPHLLGPRPPMQAAGHPLWRLHLGPPCSPLLRSNGRGGVHGCAACGERAGKAGRSWRGRCLFTAPGPAPTRPLAPQQPRPNPITTSTGSHPAVPAVPAVVISQASMETVFSKKVSQYAGEARQAVRRQPQHVQMRLAAAWALACLPISLLRRVTPDRCGGRERGQVLGRLLHGGIR